MFLKNYTGRSSSRTILFYVLFWFIYLLFFSFQRFIVVSTMNPDVEFWGPGGYVESLVTNILYLPEVIIASHFVVNYLLPQFYFRNQFRAFTLLMALSIILYPLLPMLVRFTVVEKLYPSPLRYSFENYLAAMLIYVFGMAPLAWFKIARHLRNENELRRKIENERLETQLKLREAELKLLKSQIHPHFLFNTLNNLYSLSLEKSDKTPELIIRLSDMLSYIIYDCKSEKVSLSKEVDFIRNYIELQRVRYDSCDISFNVKGEIINQQIAPMILHTFIDNGFKHGAEVDPDNPWIKISIVSNNGTLFMSVLNSMRNNSLPEKQNTGIGIVNVRKRLDLLYKEKYELVLQNSGNKYAVLLKLQL